MSAIAGIIQTQYPINMENGIQLMNALQEYPADCVNTWQDEYVFMGHHTQWVTPESVYDQQPRYDPVKQIAITADVILDNREELFNRLQVHHELRSSITDSEIIILAYMKWGQNAPHYLIGDFAFVLYDKRNELIFGARDLQGTRSLYYYNDNYRFIFCTVIQPLFTQPNIVPRLDEDWMAEFLAIPIMIESTNARNTAYTGIYQLEPGHTFTLQGSKLTINRYGTLVPEGTIHYKKDSDYIEAFRDVFGEAVRSKTRSYRQVGATLSGGLDSSAVVSFAARSLQREQKPLYTYSSVPVPDFTDWTAKSMVADESPYVRAIVKHVGNINAHYLDLPHMSPYSEIDELLDIQESPYKVLESSYWIKGIYSQAAQHDVGILLTGAKGNYTISWGSALEYYAQLLKQGRYLTFYQELTRFCRNAGVSRKKVWRIVQQLAYNRGPTEEPFELPPYIHPDLARRTSVFEKLRYQNVGLSPSYVKVTEERQQYFNHAAILSLQGTFNCKLSLKYKVRERDPTCDPRVVRFCLSVPFEQYVRGGIGRSLVRRALINEIPDEVRLNVKTRGFQGADWVHRMQPNWETFTSEVQQLCQDPIAGEYLDTKQIQISLSKMVAPSPELAEDPDMKILMRSLIVYRFLHKLNSLKGGEIYEKSVGSTCIGST